jgi:hypothetical protein
VRIDRLLLCTSLLLASSAAFAGFAQEDMSHVITKLDLERTRSEAHARCVQDVPAAIEWLRDPVIDHYCLVRHGATRKTGLFLGVRLSVELEREGMVAQAAIVDQLVDVLEASGENSGGR